MNPSLEIKASSLTVRIDDGHPHGTLARLPPNTTVAIYRKESGEYDFTETSPAPGIVFWKVQTDDVGVTAVERVMMLTREERLISLLNDVLGFLDYRVLRSHDMLLTHAHPDAKALCKRINRELAEGK